MDADTAVNMVEWTDDLFRGLFLKLPPLGSREYLNLLKTASKTELPAQILARAYRQLALSGNNDAADATLERLIASPEYDYLQCVRNMAERRVIQGQNEHDQEDLIQETVREIVCVLPTHRGEYAETAWVAFAKQCFEDAWRKVCGRNGGKFARKRTEPVWNAETGDFVDPLDALYEDDHLWPATMRDSDLFPWLEAFIVRVINKIADPNIRLIAMDHFGDDPSPISSGRSRNGKPPLIDQTGLDRFQVRRAINAARARICAELEQQKEREIDIDSFRHVLLKVKPAAIVNPKDDERKVLDRRKRESNADPTQQLSSAPRPMTKAVAIPRNKGN